MSEFDRFVQEQLDTDPRFRQEYERLAPLYDAISESIRYRVEQGLTQKQLAQRMGKQQPAIGRFESGRVWPSLRFLQELAEAMNARLILNFQPLDEVRRKATRVAEGKARYSSGR
ncbi:MAG TPA: helix-turn-helix transcriptional regulator [Dehalococcoidia bacterium]|nr:helix-turn-helix transcriptional regulator [Dehalococcoidia bacterium]